MNAVINISGFVYLLTDTTVAVQRERDFVPLVRVTRVMEVAFTSKSLQVVALVEMNGKALVKRFVFVSGRLVAIDDHVPPAA